MTKKRRRGSRSTKAGPELAIAPDTAVEKLSWKESGERLDRMLATLKDDTGASVLLTGEVEYWRDLIKDRFDAAHDDFLTIALHATAAEPPVHTVLQLWASVTSALVRGPEELLDAVARSAEQADPEDAEWLDRFVTHLRSEREALGSRDTININAPGRRPLRLLSKMLDTLSEERPVVLAVLDAAALLSPSMWAALTRTAENTDRLLLLIAPGPDPFGGLPKVSGPTSWLRYLHVDSALESDPPTAQDLAPRLAVYDLDADLREDVAAYLLRHGATHGKAVDEVMAALTDALAQGRPLEELTATPPKELLGPLPPPGDGELDRDQRDRLLRSAAREGREIYARAHALALDLDPDVVDDTLDGSAPVVEELEHVPHVGSWRYRFAESLRRSSILAEAYSDPDDLKDAQSLLDTLARDLLPGDRRLLPVCAELSVCCDDRHRAERLLVRALSADPPGLLEDGLALLAESEAVQNDLRERIASDLAEHIAGTLDPIEAGKRLDALLKWTDSISDKQARAAVLLATGRMKSRGGDRKGAATMLAESQRLFERGNRKREAAEAALEHAAVALSQGNEKITKELLNLARKISSDVSLRARASFLRGVIARLKRKAPESAEHFTRAYHNARDCEAYILALDAARAAAEALTGDRRVDEAIALLNDAVPLARALVNLPRQISLMQLSAQLHSSISRNEEARGLSDEALSLAHQRAQAAGVNAAQDALLRSCLYHAGLFAAVAGDAPEAAELLRRSADAAEVAGDKTVHAESLFNLGQATAAMGRQTEAADLVREALDNAESLNEERREMMRKVLERLTS